MIAHLAGFCLRAGACFSPMEASRRSRLALACMAAFDQCGQIFVGAPSPLFGGRPSVLLLFGFCLVC